MNSQKQVHVEFSTIIDYDENEGLDESYHGYSEPMEALYWEIQSHEPTWSRPTNQEDDGDIEQVRRERELYEMSEDEWNLSPRAEWLQSMNQKEQASWERITAHQNEMEKEDWYNEM